MMPDITVRELSPGKFVAGWTKNVPNEPGAWEPATQVWQVCGHPPHNTAYEALACAVGRLIQGEPEPDPYSIEMHGCGPLTVSQWWDEPSDAGRYIDALIGEPLPRRRPILSYQPKHGANPAAGARFRSAAGSLVPDPATARGTQSYDNL
jgi:hypothetical protein